MADTSLEHYRVDDPSSMGFLMGLIFMLVLAFILFFYGLPYFRNMSNGIHINVPGSIDVTLRR